MTNIIIKLKVTVAVTGSSSDKQRVYIALYGTQDKEIEDRTGCARDSFTKHHKLILHQSINLKT